MLLTLLDHSLSCHSHGHNAAAWATHTGPQMLSVCSAYTATSNTMPTWHTQLDICISRLQCYHLLGHFKTEQENEHHIFTRIYTVTFKLNNCKHYQQAPHRHQSTVNNCQYRVLDSLHPPMAHSAHIESSCTRMLQQCTEYHATLDMHACIH